MSSLLRTGQAIASLQVGVSVMPQTSVLVETRFRASYWLDTVPSALALDSKLLSRSLVPHQPAVGRRLAQLAQRDVGRVTLSKMEDQ